MYVRNLFIFVWICAGILGVNTTVPFEGPASSAAPSKGPASSAAPSEDPASSAAPSEGPASSAAPPEGPASSAAPSEGPASSAAPSEGPASSAAPSEGPASSAAPSEGPASSAAPSEGPASSAAPSEGPASSAAPSEGPASSAAPSEGPASSAAPSEGPASSAAPSEGPASSAVPSEGPATSAAPSEGPASSAAPSEGPASSAAPSEGPASSAAPSEGPASSAAPSEGPASSAVPSEGPTSSAAPSEGPASSAVPSDEPTTPAPKPCSPNPCGIGVQCEERFNNFICFCIGGQTYNEGQKRCDDAKVFPGNITLPNLSYKPEMNNTRSQVFQETATVITEAMKACFPGPDGYIDSRVLKLSPMSLPTRTLGSLRASSVNATVENFFQTISTITEKKVKKSIDDGLKESLIPEFKGGEFTVVDLCIVNPPCNTNSTTCSFNEGTFTCPCNSGYIESGLSSRICTVCPSGQQASGKDCVECSFGYSGFNCNESWKLTLVIVGTVLGGLLLVMLIVVPIVARKPSKKSTSKSAEKGFESPYVTQSTAKTPMPNGSFAKSQVTAMAYANAGVPKIPRATSNNSGWDRGSNLEMTESNSRQSLVAKGYNGVRTYEDPDLVRNFNNRGPYDISLSQNQGQTNPYYMHDNGRRFN